MATQKVRPDPGFVDRQHENQRRQSRRRKVGALALVAVLVVAGVVIGISTLRSGDEGKVIPGSAPTPTATPIPLLHSGALEPGTYVVHQLDHDLDAANRITISIPDGYEGVGGSAVLKLDRTSQTGVSVWAVGNLYADPCDWSGTLLDPPAGSSFDRLVVALESQRGLHVSTHSAYANAGFTGVFMERTVPARTNLADCFQGEFRTWLATNGGARFLDPGQRDLLWIVNVDGGSLVIDATLDAGATDQVRAELIQIVESIRIGPR